MRRPGLTSRRRRTSCPRSCSRCRQLNHLHGPPSSSSTGPRHDITSAHPTARRGRRARMRAATPPSSGGRAGRGRSWDRGRRAGCCTTGHAKGVWPAPGRVSTRRAPSDGGSDARAARQEAPGTAHPRRVSEAESVPPAARLGTTSGRPIGSEHDPPPCSNGRVGLQYGRGGRGPPGRLMEARERVQLPETDRPQPSIMRSAWSTMCAPCLAISDPCPMLAPMIATVNPKTTCDHLRCCRATRDESVAGEPSPVSHGPIASWGSVRSACHTARAHASTSLRVHGENEYIGTSYTVLESNPSPPPRAPLRRDALPHSPHSRTADQDDSVSRWRVVRTRREDVRLTWFHCSFQDRRTREAGGRGR